MVELKIDENLKVIFINKGKSFVKIIMGENTFIKQFANLCYLPKIFENNNYIIVYAKNYESGYSVLVFNKNNKSFDLNENVTDIIINNEQLNLLFPKTLIGTAKNTIYNLTSLQFSPIKSFYVDVDFNGTKHNEKGLTLFYAIKSEYFSVAKNLLSPSLQQIATNEMLTNYFKDYNKIIKNPFNDQNESYLVFSKDNIFDLSFTINNDLLIDNFVKK